MAACDNDVTSHILKRYAYAVVALKSSDKKHSQSAVFCDAT